MRARVRTGSAPVRVTVGVALAVGLTGIVACSSRAASPSPSGIVRIVDGPATRYERIEVTTATRSAVVVGNLQANAAPLLAARTFAAPQALSEYGLDQPRATLTYVAGGHTVAVVALGGTDFDNHGVYVRRVGDPRVFLVVATTAAPLLALVGVTLPPPTD